MFFLLYGFFKGIVMFFGGFFFLGCKGRRWNFFFGFLEEVLKKIKGNGMILGGKKKKKGLKWILIKLERRLLFFVLGKGELEGFGFK